MPLQLQPPRCRRWPGGVGSMRKKRNKPSSTWGWIRSQSTRLAGSSKEAPKLGPVVVAKPFRLRFRCASHIDDPYILSLKNTKAPPTGAFVVSKLFFALFLSRYLLVRVPPRADLEPTANPTKIFGLLWTAHRRVGCAANRTVSGGAHRLICLHRFLSQLQ